MKKIFRLFILIIVAMLGIGFVSSLMGYTNNPFDSNGTKLSYTDYMKNAIKTTTLSTLNTNDDIDDQTQAIAQLKLNETNAAAWIGSTTLTSYNELCQLYSDAWRTVRSYAAYEPVKRIETYFYVKVVNSNTTSNLLVHADITFNVSGFDTQERNMDDVPEVSIESINLEYKFTEGTYQIANISDSLTLGEYKELGLIADSISSNGGVIYIPFLDGHTMSKQYLDITSAYHYNDAKVKDITEYDENGNVSNIKLDKYTTLEVNALCDSIISDLFEYTYLHETDYATGQIWTVSQDGFNSLNDGRYAAKLGSAWTDAYGEYPVHDLWEYVYSQQIYHDAWAEKYEDQTLADDYTNNFVFAFNMINEATADEIIFYLKVEFDDVIDETPGYDMLVGSQSLYYYQDGKLTLCTVGQEFYFANWRVGGFEETYLIGKSVYENDAVGVDYFGYNIALNETDMCDEIIRCCFEMTEAGI